MPRNHSDLWLCVVVNIAAVLAVVAVTYFRCMGPH